MEFSKRSIFVILLLVEFGYSSTNESSSIAANGIPELFAVTYPTAIATNISLQCVQDSQSFTTALLKRETWALEMYASTGKFPETNGGGELYSTEKLQSVGLFDECLSIDSTPNKFKGKYCTAMFTLESIKAYEIDEESNSLMPLNGVKTNWIAMYQLPQWFSAKQPVSGPVLKRPKKRPFKNSGFYFIPFTLPSIGYCIPSSCSGQDFASAVAQLVGQRAVGNATSTVDGQVQYKSIVTLAGDNYCYSEEVVKTAPKFDTIDLVYMSVLSVLGAAIVAGTLHEIWRDYTGFPIDPNTDVWVVSTLHCFSILSNARQLLSTQTSPSDLSCLYGIRFITMSLIVLLHAYSSNLYRNSFNKFSMTGDNLTWQMQGIANSIYLVDTFFLLSGLLVAYGLVSELDLNNGRFNVPLFYLHRYLRLTFVYAIILGFIATLLVYIGTGPNWQIVRDMRESCRDNWWTNLLYIHTYRSVRPNPEMCMFESWYLACDMQMFWLSPLLIYPLWRWSNVGLLWVHTCIVSLISASIATSAVLYAPSNEPSNNDTNSSNSSEVPYYNDYYFQIWSRFPPYLVGIALGWMLYRTRKSKINLNMIKVVAGWVTSGAIVFEIINGLIPYLKEDTVPEANPFVRVATGSLLRLTWAYAVGWVIVVCVNGNGGFVDRLLSWKVFVPLGRLTYVAYLLYWNFVKIHMYYSRKPLYFNKLEQTLYYVCILPITYGAAFVVALLVETPLLNLERLIFGGAGISEGQVDIGNDGDGPDMNALEFALLNENNRKAFGDFSDAISKETGDVEIPFLSGKNQDAFKAELNVPSGSGSSPTAKKTVSFVDDLSAESTPLKKKTEVDVEIPSLN